MNKKLIIFDMDGTIYLGANLIDGALETFDYLKKNNKAFQVYFDATAPHKLKKEDVKLYEQLLKKEPEHFRQIPAGTRADDFLLMLATDNKKALILTQDRFRDHVDKFPWLKTQKRVFPGMVMNKMIYFPDISLKIPVQQTENHSCYCL